MKKMIYSLLAVLTSVFICNTVFAQNFSNNTKQATIQQFPTGTSSYGCSILPTCLAINNYSSDIVYVDVPAIGVYTSALPGYTTFVSSYDYDYKQLVLSDWTHYTIFNSYVPPHFEVDVLDYAGKFVAKAK